MKLERTYSFSDQEARARIRALTDYWATKYGVRVGWSDHGAHIAGKVKGVGFEGNLEVLGGRLVADIKAGFLAEKLGGRHYVESKLETYLDPAQTLDELEARVR